ncbi:DUF72 domain-containing protein [Bernardetia sp. Wsw4-3y2]|uniref:DUF72 domain-containing protein n=1 Tax=Bernardetia sp. Wsw4-3y2 TaxID=3127471 RepID=UPI0030D55971
MEFGKLQNINNIDFTLLDNHPETEAFLSKLEPTPKPIIRIAAPVWGTPEWKGIWYPQKAKPTDFLYHYSRQFDSIELNVTHYQIPPEERILKWKEMTPKGFLFCPKIYKGISHHKQLVDCEDLTNVFCDRVALFGDRLGICFLQLPPHFSPQKAGVLINYLENFPADTRLAIEFRHKDWFDYPNQESREAVSEVFSVMRRYNFTALMTDVSGRRDVMHMRLTSDTMVLRLVGNSLDKTDYERMEDWVERMDNWIKEGLKEFYFWLHQPENIKTAEMAVFLIQKLKEKGYKNIVPPKKIETETKNDMPSLF